MSPAAVASDRAEIAPSTTLAVSAASVTTSTLVYPPLPPLTALVVIHHGLRGSVGRR